MQQHESVWPTICGMFDIPAEQEQAFTRDLGLSLADATYFIETHEAKRRRKDELYDRRHALEQALAAVDAALPARLADYASRGLDVAGAAHMLARHRLAVADRLAACNSEFLAVADAANADWKLASQALKARDELSAYWEGAWRRYRLEVLLERNRLNPHVSPEFTVRMYDRARIACLGNTHERLGFERTALPSYTGLDRDARRRHMAAHIAGTAEQSTGR